MIELKDANKIMGKINYSADIIQNKMYEFDKKRMKSKKAYFIHEGLRFAHEEMCYLLDEIELYLLSSDSESKDSTHNTHKS